MKKALQMIMAVLLLLGMLGTQVFAAGAVENTAENKSTTGEQSFRFKSTLQLPENTIVPSVEVSYAIEGIAGTGCIAGPSEATVGSVQFSNSDVPEDSASGGIVEITKDVTVTFPANTFKAVGIYRYKITQTIPANTGVVAESPITQYLDVFVQNNDGDTGLEVAYFVLASTANDTASSTSYTGKSDGFQNTYNSHTLTVTKKVAGNQGDKKQSFSFPITITGAQGKTYKYELSNRKTGKFTAGTEQTLQLKHGETIKITGLTAWDTYTVSEAQAAEYITTYKIDNGSVTPYNTALTDTISADRTITFINTKDANTPTGVILTFMPYILMILAGFVVASLFLHRKRR